MELNNLSIYFFVAQGNLKLSEEFLQPKKNNSSLPYNKNK